MKRILPTAAALLALSAGSVQAQAPTGGSAPAARATQLPLSGSSGEGGSVVVQPGSIQVSGALAGSVLGEAPPAGPVRLSMAEAVKRALKANLGPVTANDQARAARDQRVQSLSTLLPNIAANASDTVTQVNLAAYGFQFNVPSSLGFSIPSVVGPYNYSQLQGTLSQSVFDLVSRRNWRSAQATERAAELSAADMRQMVVLAVAGSYLQTVAAQARVASQQAQVDNAQAIYKQAEARKAAGTNARIDVTRSLVELQTERQKLSSQQADMRKQLIGLARLTGLPLDREIALADPLEPNPVPAPDAKDAIRSALEHRSDLRALEAGVKAAELALSAARAERLPSASLNGDYGVIGPNPAHTHGVFAVTGAVTVPIWQGGRIGADIDQANVTLHHRQAELADQKTRVEQGVRNALIDLETANGQVEVARNNKALAADTLTQARDRFAAGVATTLEVVQAQQQVASSESDYISSLFSMNLARLSLARELGHADTELAHTEGRQ